MWNIRVKDNKKTILNETTYKFAIVKLYKICCYHNISDICVFYIDKDMILSYSKRRNVVYL